MTDLATLKTQLTSAEAKYNEVILAFDVESATEGGRSVKYNPNYIQQLRAHINSLKRQIAQLDSSAKGAGPYYP